MPRGGPSVAGPRGFERTFDRTWSGGGVPGQGRASRGAEPDPVKLVQEFLPIDREAFQAADTLLNAAPGSDEFRRAEGRLIREAGETTGRMLRDTAKEALHTVRSKEFWKGSRGGRRARRGASPSSSPFLDPGDDGSHPRIGVRSLLPDPPTVRLRPPPHGDQPPVLPGSCVLAPVGRPRVRRPSPPAQRHQLDSANGAHEAALGGTAAGSGRRPRPARCARGSPRPRTPAEQDAVIAQVSIPDRVPEATSLWFAAVMDGEAFPGRARGLDRPRSKRDLGVGHRAASCFTTRAAPLGASQGYRAGRLTSSLPPSSEPGGCACGNDPP